jgi:hypothetical protein
MGLLEPAALPSIEKENWVPLIQETDALLVWGGDPLYLSYWMRRSGLADLLPSLSNPDLVEQRAVGGGADHRDRAVLGENRDAAAVMAGHDPAGNGRHESRTGPFDKS